MIEAPANLAPDVSDVLAERWTDLGDQDFVVLPTQTRDGQSYYVEDDLDGLTLARADGLRVTFLHSGKDRRFLHENAAGWALVAAIAIGENVGSVGVAALCRYLWLRVRHAKDRGLYEGDEAAAPLKVTLFRIEQNGATGDETANGVQLEGHLEDVLKSLDRIFGSTDGS